MKLLLVPLAALSFLSVAPLLPGSTPDPDALEQLQLARRALAEGFPQAFLPALESLANNPAAEGELRQQASLLLAESLLAAGRAEHSLEIARHLPPSPESDLLQARALSALENWSMALAAYERAAAANDASVRADAALGAARCLIATQEWAAAQTWLAKIPADSPVSAAARLEEARLALWQNQPARAATVLNSIPEIPPALQPTFTYLNASTLLARGDAEGALLALGGSVSLEQNGSADEAMVVLQARCLLASGQESKAESLLERYLRQAIGEAPRLAALELLDSIYAAQDSPSISELRRLADDEAEPLRALDAGYFLARAEERTGRNSSALGWFRRVASEHPSIALRNSARLAAAELLAKQGDFAAAQQEIASLTLPEADFLRGQIAYEQQNFRVAEEHFTRAMQSPELREHALYNAAVSRLLGQPSGEPNPWQELLAKQDRTPERVERLRLLAALEAARQRSPMTDELFRAAWPTSALPWAEWRLISGDHTGASRLLLAAQARGDAADSEGTDFLQIFLSDDGTDAGQLRAMEQARQFLQRYPESPRRREAGFKLAELEFQRGDYLAARSRLEQLATDFPAGAEAQQAWFLAGVASARLLQEDAIEQALLDFEEAAKGENELAWRARFEQALLLSARGAPEEALVLLNRVITSSSDPSLRSAARVEKGDALFSLASSAQPPGTALDEAIRTWQDLAADPDAPLSWKEQAWVKAGAALEKAGRPREALQNYYRVLLGRESATAEDFWFYKAGFEAARLLEGQSDWSEAIRIYERLGRMEGPRAAEASARANRLRLEKFLWNE